MFNSDGPWENNPIDEPLEDPELFGDDASDFEEVQDENELCDCDPDYKEAVPIQRSAGASFGGFGGEIGDGTTVIVCKKCGGRFYEEEPEHQEARGNGWDF